MRKTDRVLVYVFGGLLVLVIVMLTGCGPATYQAACDVPTAPPLTVPVLPVPTVVDPTVQTIQSIVDAENVNREAQGQTALTPGLSCQIFTFTGGTGFLNDQFTGVQWKQSFLLTSPFNQQNAPNSDGLNIIPQPLQSLYVNEYGIQCTGSIVTTEDAYYAFQLQADDAAVMYLDGQLLNDDGQHSVTTANGIQYLRAGVHSFQLKFAQNYGVEQLVLLSASGNYALTVQSPAYFFH